MIIHASSASYSPAEAKVLERVNSPVPIVLFTRREDFTFNEELRKLDKWVLADLAEMGWDVDIKDTHLFGVNSYKFPQYENPEYKKFDDWVTEKPPLVYFKRELLAIDCVDNLHPIDYPCYTDIPEPQTREEFNRRIFNVFHYWGRSSEDRVFVHCDFWRRSSINGASICDNIYYINGFASFEENPNKWISVHIPHYSRIPIEEILKVNGNSKLSLSLKGSGYKCFRSSESPVNSIMVMEDAGIKFAYDWVHGENCIMFKSDESPIDAIEQALGRSDLYNIYLKGVETVKKYHVDNYSRHIESVIKSYL